MVGTNQNKQTKSPSEKYGVEKVILMFQDWVDSFYSLESFSKYYKISKEEAQTIISEGRSLAYMDSKKPQQEKKIKKLFIGDFLCNSENLFDSPSSF